jgi:hypothetical protein
MLRHIRTFICAALLAAVAAAPQAARGGSLASGLRAIRSAEDANAAAVAYRTAVRAHRTSSAVREAYVEKMLDLDAPQRASSAARLLVAMDQSNTVGWSALVLAYLRDGEHARAVGTLADHAELLQDSPAMAEAAGRLAGWYEGHRRNSPRAGQIAPKVKTIRSKFAAGEGYQAAYRAAVKDIDMAPPNGPEHFSADDFTVHYGLHVGVRHVDSDFRVAARLDLDPQVSWAFRGAAVGFHTFALAGGNTVLLSTRGGTFYHGTVQVIAIPVVIYPHGGPHQRVTWGSTPGTWTGSAVQPRQDDEGASSPPPVRSIRRGRSVRRRGVVLGGRTTAVKRSVRRRGVILGGRTNNPGLKRTNTSGH